MYSMSKHPKDQNCEAKTKIQENAYRKLDNCPRKIYIREVLKDISQVFNRFLRNGGVEDNAKAKVAWKDVCFPKEGGLGLKDLESSNISAIMRHIWVMFARSGSLWVAWVQAYLLKGKSFWNVSTP